MTQDEIEAIAQRPTYCKADGEAVTLSRAERDGLVAIARDGRLLERAAREALGFVSAAEQDYADGNLRAAEELLALALAPFDAVLAKESP